MAKKVMVGGEGKSGGDTHDGMTTHINSSHSKPEIFEKNIHPKAMGKAANTHVDSADCNY